MTCMLALWIVELTTGRGFFLLGVVLLSLASVVSPLVLLFIVAGELTAAWRTRVEGLESLVVVVAVADVAHSRSGGTGGAEKRF